MTMTLEIEDLIRIWLAVVCGGVIGLEREYRDKAAGFRTMIFISMGAALFTLLSAKLAGNNDPTRIAAGIVTGVGFLGAGVILREGGHVIGLTTASTVWLTAALGTAIGGGFYALAFATLAVSLVVLWVFPRFEQWIDNMREARTYEVMCGLNPAKISALEITFQRCGLRIGERHQAKDGDQMRVRWHAMGKPADHERLVKELFADPEVLGLKF